MYKKKTRWTQEELQMAATVRENKLRILVECQSERYLMTKDEIDLISNNLSFYPRVLDCGELIIPTPYPTIIFTVLKNGMVLYRMYQSNTYCRMNVSTHDEEIILKLDNIKDYTNNMSYNISKLFGIINDVELAQLLITSSFYVPFDLKNGIFYYQSYFIQLPYLSGKSVYLHQSNFTNF